MKSFPILALLLLTTLLTSAQNLPDSCKLKFGTNLGGLADYGTELPFVDLMHNCREWYTKDVGNPNPPFNSEHANQLTYRPDGYPTHLPQTVPGTNYEQRICTIWAITDGWEPGTYTVLYDGTGTLSFWGGHSNLQQTSPNRITFDFNNPVGSILEMTILTSSQADPIRNIRLLMPGSEATYQTQPFNPIWIDKLKIFRTVRFMDWFHTNSWGQAEPWVWDTPALFDWSERQQMDHYTWADTKGIPYEMAIQLMNDYDLDGWVCVPHRASNGFIQNMAQLFHDNLEPQRQLTVEYSNETWNWIFGQAQWLNKYGCVDQNIPWPEGTVPYIQNCLDIWTTVYGNDVDRIQRTVGIQTAWQDVSNRTVFNLQPGTFDAFSPTYYFGLSDEADAALDALGTAATAADIAYWARKTWNQNEKQWILSQKQSIADPLQLPMLFYEGGQHLTPHPFGEEPTYAQALLDIQRDTALYNLYQEAFGFLRTLQSGTDPLLLMNFSFISSRSARYGSWGILETMNQDTNIVPAPKYRAIVDNLANCLSVSAVQAPEQAAHIRVYPNPTCDKVQIGFDRNSVDAITVSTTAGNLIATYQITDTDQFQLPVGDQPSGIYLIRLTSKGALVAIYKVVKK